MREFAEEVLAEVGEDDTEDWALSLPIGLARRLRDHCRRVGCRPADLVAGWVEGFAAKLRFPDEAEESEAG